MRIIADLHIHSKYSRATSGSMDIPNISKWAKYKGISVIGTSDFTHPLWLKELKKYLKPAGFGVYEHDNTYFFLTVELNCIYSRNNKTRKIHNLVLSPSIEIAEKINIQLAKFGNLAVDGRPILKLDSEYLLKLLLDISPEIMLIPAHAWTPHFSLFGSNSGFNTIEECFGTESGHIHAIETGLSSDPAMNWRLSRLDNISLISNSDAHSMKNIGREANVFEISDLNNSYREITQALKTKDKNKFLYTIEFFPEEGKYHYDGHRLCNVCLSPEESMKNGNLCAKCGQKVTVGVLHRVEELADRKNIDSKGRVPYKSLIPLEEIIADAMGSKKGNVPVESEYFKLINSCGNEFDILMEKTYQELVKFTAPRIAEGIIKMRQGKVKLNPGYDGEYGKILINWDDKFN